MDWISESPEDYAEVMTNSVVTKEFHMRALRNVLPGTRVVFEPKEPWQQGLSKSAWFPVAATAEGGEVFFRFLFNVGPATGDQIFHFSIVWPGPGKEKGRLAAAVRVVEPGPEERRAMAREEARKRVRERDVPGALGLFLEAALGSGASGSGDGFEEMAVRAGVDVCVELSGLLWERLELLAGTGSDGVDEQATELEGWLRKLPFFRHAMAPRSLLELESEGSAAALELQHKLARFWFERAALPSAKLATINRAILTQRDLAAAEPLARPGEWVRRHLRLGGLYEAAARFSAGGGQGKGIDTDEMGKMAVRAFRAAAELAKGVGDRDLAE